MKEIRYASVNKRKVPVLISDENEALLAAKAAGGAIVGLWGPDKGDSWCGAEFIVESLDCLDETYLERVARRHLGLPWNICETRRLKIREMCWDDFEEVWENHVGRGFESIDALEAYTKNQYRFYEFGFWALTDKKSGSLVGVAGLTIPREYEDDGGEWYAAEAGPKTGGAGCGPEKRDPAGRGGAECGGAECDPGECGGAECDAAGCGPAGGREPESLTLELGYHIFPPFRRMGLAKEACLAIMEYGKKELGVTRFIVRIHRENLASKAVACALRFKKEGNT